jgi:glycerophosphoryl diester phosphodiesterase
MTALPAAFLGAPLAHRGLHDAARGIPENSRAAFEAAIAGGYGIELDVQLSADGQAIVFHDYDLRRLTGTPGPLRQRSAAALAELRLANAEPLPTLPEVLALVAGRAALLVEIKDQDGAMGPRVGTLETAVAEAVRDYEGPLAVMSFNPHAVIAFGKAAPGVPRGLTSCGYRRRDWPLLPPRAMPHLRDMPMYEDAGASFLSHRAADLGRARVAALKAAGAAVLCWTVRSLEEERAARQVADNITFEGYPAPLP